MSYKTEILLSGMLNQVQHDYSVCSLRDIFSVNSAVKILKKPRKKCWYPKQRKNYFLNIYIDNQPVMG